MDLNFRIKFSITTCEIAGWFNCPAQYAPPLFSHQMKQRSTEICMCFSIPAIKSDDFYSSLVIIQWTSTHPWICIQFPVWYSHLRCTARARQSYIKYLFFYCFVITHVCLTSPSICHFVAPRVTLDCLAVWCDDTIDVFSLFLIWNFYKKFCFYQKSIDSAARFFPVN